MCCLKTTPPPLPSRSHAHSWVRLSLVCLLLVYMLQDSETVTGFGWWRGGPCNWTHLSLLSRFLFHSLTQNTQYSSLCPTAGRWCRGGGGALLLANGSRVWHYMRHDMLWPAAGMLSGDGGLEGWGLRISPTLSSTWVNDKCDCDGGGSCLIFWEWPSSELNIE